MKLPLVAGVGLVAVLAFGLVGRQATDTTPEGCLRAFLDALNAKDYVKARSLIDAGKAGDTVAPPMNGLPTAQYELKSPKTFGQGDEVVLGAEIEVANRGSSLNDLFHMKNVEGHWRIEALNLGNMAVAPPSLIAAFLSSVPPPARKAANSTVCISNVKQLSLGNIIYANDYDDRMPPSDHWKSDIFPYVKNEDIFHCPDDKRPKAVSYRMSDYLSKVNSTAIAEPAATVMIYEGEGGYLVARHDNRGSAGYSDGHAKLVNSDVFKQGYHK